MCKRMHALWKKIGTQVNESLGMEYAEMFAGSRTHARPTAVHARIHAMQTREFNMPPPVCKRDLLRRCCCRRKG